MVTPASNLCPPASEASSQEAASSRFFGNRYHGTASTGNDGVLCVDCDSRRDVGPTKIIQGVFRTQPNLCRLAVLSAVRQWSF